MDRATFRTEIKRIVSEYELIKHPYVELVSQGKASREQLKGYPVQHYEMTVRDSAPLSAMLYLKVSELDQAAGAKIAQSFAEEALGSYSHTASHTDLLFELWEGGLGLARKQLVESIGSEDSCAFNACLYRLLCLKPHFLGAFGLMEEMEVHAYLKLMNGMRLHYDIKPEHLRFFSVHYEADKDHSEAGHELIERFVSGSGREEEFLAEARGLAHFFWKGFDSMLAA
jgi:pyrroloquinoline quinone (PQQ) biosynthesis protein C